MAWMETGRRAGWRVEGLGLPGHFLVRVHGREDETLADPFHGGGTLTRSDLKHLLHTLAGKPVALSGLDLGGRPAGDLLLRMLRNLRASYRRRGDRLKGLSVAEDMLLLVPGLPEALRDRGLLRIEGGERREGFADLRAYVEAAPSDPGAEGVLRLLATMTADADHAN
jgi:regulator of sirC expression with transglutaminase-like and TPR domain